MYPPKEMRSCGSRFPNHQQSENNDSHPDPFLDRNGLMEVQQGDQSNQNNARRRKYWKSNADLHFLQGFDVTDGIRQTHEEADEDNGQRQKELSHKYLSGGKKKTSRPMSVSCEHEENAREIQSPIETRTAPVKLKNMGVKGQVPGTGGKVVVEW
jgi:hypothetical protein